MYEDVAAYGGVAVLDGVPVRVVALAVEQNPLVASVVDEGCYRSDWPMRFYDS